LIASVLRERPPLAAFSFFVPDFRSSMQILEHEGHEAHEARTKNMKKSRSPRSMRTLSCRAVALFDFLGFFASFVSFVFQDLFFRNADTAGSARHPRTACAKIDPIRTAR
jgi:hypothetical protein